MKQPPNSIVFHSTEIRKSKRSFLYDQLQHIYIVKEDTHFLINLHSCHGKTISRVITKIKIMHRSLLGIESKPSMFITFHKRASYSCFVPKDWKAPFGDDGLRYMLHEPQICSDCCCILCSVRVGSAHGVLLVECC
ncbi:uncharacterized protein LOC112509931 isoform X2 [Cynara cardunculus var. scolymus]|uniref:uncharacterized protein LOC112509931 isoform X2 n=1 Tax=Cynara cardunculus var. scolymus TaxID=59895 RepID=UPI000D62ADEB|nr:uncharacterized protein LOC112509931 isoform X2 [Cynara cardunculus var. scolymus]